MSDEDKELEDKVVGLFRFQRGRDYIVIVNRGLGNAYVTDSSGKVICAVGSAMWARAMNIVYKLEMLG